MSGDLNADLEVDDGDRLVIPVLSNTVSVVGEVKRQGTHSFQGELNLDDYIDLSAGLTRRADDGGIYIVKANGSVVTLNVICGALRAPIDLSTQATPSSC